MFRITSSHLAFRFSDTSITPLFCSSFKRSFLVVLFWEFSIASVSPFCVSFRNVLLLIIFYEQSTQLFYKQTTPTYCKFSMPTCLPHSILLSYKSSHLLYPIPLFGTIWKLTRDEYLKLERILFQRNPLLIAKLPRAEEHLNYRSMTFKWRIYNAELWYYTSHWSLRSDDWKVCGDLTSANFNSGGESHAKDSVGHASDSLWKRNFARAFVGPTDSNPKSCLDRWSTTWNPTVDSSSIKLVMPLTFCHFHQHYKSKNRDLTPHSRPDSNNNLSSTSTLQIDHCRWSIQ